MRGCGMFEKDRLGVTIFFWTLFALSEFFVRESAVQWILLAASLLVSAVTGIARARIRRAAESWPAVSGSVEFTAVQPNPDGALASLFRPHVLHIAYSYRAEGERYSGFHQQAFRREADADGLASRLKGSTVMVRYNPRSPSQSALHPEPGSR
jgi:hypothetical protein